MGFVPKKLYYKIGEVCEIVGVDAHVLRYWETEFPQLSPPKNKGGQRTYRPKDIETLLQIRNLLYEEGFTIAGARKRLAPGSSRTSGRPAGAGSAISNKVGKASSPVTEPESGAQRLQRVREELENILTLLERG
jgi:DNA-binding transcriptional MerR regulator